MSQNILSKNQKTAVDFISNEPKLADFYLSGGTALANYYLQHRFSDDLDFFISKKPDIIFLRNFTNNLKEKLNAKELRYERLYDRNQFFFIKDDEELKIEFTKYPFKQLNPTMHQDGIKIDSLRDIAANKLFTILDRFDPKDFVDLFFIFQKLDFENVRNDAENKFNTKIDNVFLGGELMKVKRIVALPKMIKPITIEELNNFFNKLAQKLAFNILE
ncbi:nucleotidyl transferase AbiEii/AbiGii toxin family protein [Patescibacteria group bacterium]|nr:nucleotidyl transferase AbiEii/AbiGii toxin family protein [Patescibacteria group bacterium]